MNKIQAQHSCKIMPKGLAATIFIAVGIGMVFTYIAIALELPTILSAVLFAGLLFLIISQFVSEATFELNEKTLTRRKEKNNFILGAPSVQQYTWNDIKSYKNGTEMGKRGEFQFLNIYFKDGNTWEIQDVFGERKDSYDKFLACFLSVVNEINIGRNVVVASSPTQETITSKFDTAPIIERKKTFYETIYAKIFTLLVLAFIIVVLLKFSSNLSGASIFRLGFIIPGFFYLFYRSFIKNRK
ncbi:MAG: hypothetical protein R2739_04100 [Chitinophagales bacterium]